MRAYLAGLRADCFNPTSPVVFFEPGSFAVAGGSDVIEVNSNVTIEPRGTGLGGRDRPAMFAEGQAVFFYLLDDGNGGIGGLCSPGYNYGDVIIPSGCTMLRKHPFMCCWRSDWGGMPSFLFEGAQNPRIRLTYPRLVALLSNAPNIPTTFDLSPYVPVAGGARLAMLHYTVRYGPGAARAGSAFIGPDSSNLLELGACNPSDGVRSSGYVEVRITSNGEIAFMVNAENVFLDLTLEGWCVTEVTN